MGIGKHKELVVIRGRATNVADGYGGVIEAYTDKWTGFALIEKLNGNRAIAAGAGVLNGTHSMRIRRNPNIDFIKTDIVIYDGTDYGIVSIDEVDNDRFLEFILSVTQ